MRLRGDEYVKTLESLEAKNVVEIARLREIEKAAWEARCPNCGVWCREAEPLRNALQPPQTEKED